MFRVLYILYIVCDLPVAKRNFSARHGHGLDIEFCRNAAPATSSPPRVSSLYQEQLTSVVDNGSKNNCRPGESASIHLAEEAKAATPMDLTGSSVIPALSDAETHWLDLLRPPRPNLDDQVNRSFWMDQLMVDDSPLLLLLDQQQQSNAPSSNGAAAVVTPRESHVSPNDSYKDGLSDDLDRDEQRPSVIGENLYLEAV